jgi:hypothetical protein
MASVIETAPTAVQSAAAPSPFPPIAQYAFLSDCHTGAEFDISTGRHLGNFPQAFSNLALIEAAGRIILAERLKEFSWPTPTT